MRCLQRYRYWLKHNLINSEAVWALPPLAHPNRLNNKTMQYKLPRNFKTLFDLHP